MSGSRFYDTTYGGFADRLNATILDESTEMLEVASGSGGPALFLIRETGCRVVGVDLLDRVEGPEANADFQEFLGMVERLAAECRLSRLAYFARRA